MPGILKKIKKIICSRKVILSKKLYPPKPDKRCLNIGGGNWYYPRWENVDFYADDAFVDYKTDIRTKIPVVLSNSSVSLIFCSHLLEHLSDDSALFVLAESCRLLKKGGLMRISVPDMDKAFDAYKNSNSVFFKKGGVSCVGDTIERNLVNFFASYAKDGYSGGPLVNSDSVRQKLQTSDKYEFVRWCSTLIPEDAPYKAHVNGYDFEKLKTLLQKAGFSKITKSAYRSSSVPVLRKKAFDNRPVVSLFVEAVK